MKIAITDAPASTHKPKFYAHYLAAAQYSGQQLWATLNKHTQGFATYLAQAFKNFTTRGVGEATIFGYWAIFSLFPLVMLGTVLATFALGQTSAQRQIATILDQFVPSGVSSLIGENINLSISQRGPFGILGIIGLLYGSIGLFTNLQGDLSRIFRDKATRPLPRQIIVGVMMLIILTSLIMGSIITSALFSVMGGQIIGRESPLFALGAIVLPLLLNLLLFILMFRYVPQRKISLRAILPSALIGAIIWELGKSLLGWYIVHLANFGAMYGSLGTVMGLLTWTYLTGCLISLCAEVAVATDDWQHRQPPAVAIDANITNKPADELPPDHPDKVVQQSAIRG